MLDVARYLFASHYVLVAIKPNSVCVMHLCNYVCSVQCIVAGIPIELLCEISLFCSRLRGISFAFVRASACPTKSVLAHSFCVFVAQLVFELCVYLLPAFGAQLVCDWYVESCVHLVTQL